MHLYRPKSKRRDGTTAENKRWACCFRFRGKECRLSLIEDKAESFRMMRKIQAIVYRAAAGVPATPGQCKWLDETLPSVRAYLARIGVAGTFETPGKDIPSLATVYRTHLLAQGRTAKHVEYVLGVVESLPARLGTLSPEQISREKLDLWVLSMQTDSLSLRTIQARIKAVKQFVRWGVRRGHFLCADALDMIPPNPRTDPRRLRRPLTEDELRGLLDHVWGGDEAHGLTGCIRATLYLLATETGLRPNELRHLAWEDLALTASPTVRVRASSAKGRREAVLPLRGHVAEVLVDMPRGGDLVFSLPPARELAQMIRTDMTDAGLDPWRVDFYSLRHTFITNLARAGVHPRTAQKLARHADITTTMRYYTHLLEGDELAAIERLPTISPCPTAHPSAS